MNQAERTQNVSPIRDTVTVEAARYFLDEVEGLVNGVDYEAESDADFIEAALCDGEMYVTEAQARRLGELGVKCHCPTCDESSGIIFYNRDRRGDPTMVEELSCPTCGESGVVSPETARVAPTGESVLDDHLHPEPDWI